ncbi:MAG: lytic transglycosylase domain-containing protein [Thermoanaerobaculia bacterium]
MTFRSLLRPAILLLALSFPAAAPLDKRVDGGTEPLANAPEATSLLALPSASPFREAAAANRQQDFAAVRRILTPLLRQSSPDGGNARLLVGFYAHANEDVDLAHEMLLSAGDPPGELEDWRLFLLADSAQARGDFPAALAFLSELLTAYPHSPLRSHSLVRGLEMAQADGDSELVLDWTERARLEPLDTDTAAILETAAWEAALTLEDRPRQQEAALRLLVHHPLEASKLQVIEIFRSPTGEIDWLAFLTPAELELRARNLLAIELPDGALVTLEAVPESYRGLDWHLTMAAVQTSRHQSSDALVVLDRAQARSVGERSRLLWQRARAEMDLATVRRGRTNLPASERQRMKELALEHLYKIGLISPDREMVVEASRLRFEELADDNRFEEAMEELRELRRLEPADTTGARHLWREGWSEYTQRNLSGAIGYWSELEGLYPESRFARSGGYWAARAHERLGNTARAHSLYQALTASDTTDFYRRLALSRLGSQPEPDSSSASTPTEPWPQDPLLARARWLTDLALDELALMELEGLESQSDARAFQGLKAVVLERLGQRRESIHSLSMTFPALGGPHQASIPIEARQMYYPLDFQELVNRHAEAHNLPPTLVLAMIRQESAFDPSARSWAGARGLMQLMPATGRELASRLGVKYTTARLSDPDFSIRLGTTYFSQVLEMFEGNEVLALAGYNGGPYRIKRLWRKSGSNAELDYFVEGLSLPETKTYVKRILLFADSYRQLYHGLG